jgi:predicted MFS family arabinose efflux permease
MWLVGSTLMGLLYDRSIPALVTLGVVAQAASAVVFFMLRRQKPHAR